MEEAMNNCPCGIREPVDNAFMAILSLSDDQVLELKGKLQAHYEGRGWVKERSVGIGEKR